MKKSCVIFLFVTLTAMLVFIACPTSKRQDIVFQEDEVPIFTVGAFRHRWWNYYERGVLYAGKKLWRHAEADFREAISQRNEDQFRARGYETVVADSMQEAGRLMAETNFEFIVIDQIREATHRLQPASIQHHQHRHD